MKLWENWHPHTLSVGKQSGTPLLWGHVAIPSTTTMHLPLDLAISSIGIYHKDVTL